MYYYENINIYTYILLLYYTIKHTLAYDAIKFHTNFGHRRGNRKQKILEKKHLLICRNIYKNISYIIILSYQSMTWKIKINANVRNLSFIPCAIGI